ncbi:hypothetical protein [Marinicellulosiphila megalodicopiae]|uniref:hypothetical protein n=1 Tax=Marinicellulosiphila megalodicopiae TaxID=2724896 RepID=UPI003BB06461
MNNEKFNYWAGSLGGYLTAISHLNDQQGFRHSFFADIVDQKHSTLEDSICKRLKINDIKLIKSASELDTIKLFASTVKRNVFNNFLLGDHLKNKEIENLIKERIQWHIEEYITLIETISEIRPESWSAKVNRGNSEIEYIFFRFDKHIMMVGFSHTKKVV